jgi:hypothetical protein
VGGSALELYTSGAYVTGDLDFVGSATPAIHAALVGAGFVRSGRHWVHEEARVFVEFPSSDLGTQQAIEATFGRTKVRLLSPEDLVVDRLAAARFWDSPVDLQNARLLLRSLRGDLDRVRLRRNARSAQVLETLDSLLAEVGVA